MAAVQQRPPQDRYGRGADAASDRRLKRLGAVLGVVAVAVVGWYGVFHITGTDVSGELIKWDVVDGRQVSAHLEIRKDAGASGVCTIRGLSEAGAEVGRKDVRAEPGETRVDTVVTMRTTGRATSAELVGCQEAG